jgi:protein-tyrosine-phosphatase/biotin operon repressor
LLSQVNAMSPPLRVLFLCVANSARSLMAEALLRQSGAGRYAVFSAGSRPAQPDPRALAALEATGVPVEGLRSKAIDEYAGEHFDYVITLCDKAALECAALPEADEFLAWHFEDPAGSQHPQAYRQTLQAIHERIKLFLLINDKEQAQLADSLTPLALFKCLADETRARLCLLIASEGELCVCELTAALQQSQPKISRHLAALRACGLLEDRRRGQWVYYRLHPLLPAWARAIVELAGTAAVAEVAADRTRLCCMGERPLRLAEQC